MAPNNRFVDSLFSVSVMRDFVEEFGLDNIDTSSEVFKRYNEFIRTSSRKFGIMVSICNVYAYVSFPTGEGIAVLDNVIVLYTNSYN